MVMFYTIIVLLFGGLSAWRDRAVTLADAVANYEMRLRDRSFCPQLLNAIRAAIALANDALAKLDPVG